MGQGVMTMRRFVNQLLTDDIQPMEEDMIDGWEEEEIEANRIEMLAQKSENADRQPVLATAPLS